MHENGPRRANVRAWPIIKELTDMNETTAAPVARRGRPGVIIAIGAALGVLGSFMAYQFNQSLSALQALAAQPSDVVYAASGLTSYTLRDQITAATFLVWASVALAVGGLALLAVGASKLRRSAQ